MSVGFELYQDLPRRPGEATADYNVKNYIRLLNYVGNLVGDILPADDKINAVDADFTPHDMTYLKLAALMAYTRTFLHFGKSASRFFYLDVLSASGLSRLAETGDPIPGSALCVPLAHVDFKAPPTGQQPTFDRVYCFEGNDKALAALETRVEGMRHRGFPLPDFSFVAGDANSNLELALREIAAAAQADWAKSRQRPLTLVFVDNLGMNIPMATISTIQSRVRGDLVIHIPTQAIWRNIKAHKTTRDDRRALTAFFGDDGWAGLKRPDDIPTLYHKKVQEATGSNLQDSFPVRIHGGKNMFHLAIYARHTKGTEGKPGWISRIRPLLEACNRIDHHTINQVKSVATGKQTQLPF